MKAVLTGLVLYWTYDHLAQSPLEEWQFEEGDHIWCHVSGRFMKLIQHHGICVSVGGVLFVIHFDGEHNDDWYVYQDCPDCQARLDVRRNAGNPEQNVRLSCFRCFSRGERFYRCEYGRSLGSVALRETGSRSTQTSLPGDVVVNVARYFYQHNNFGEYHVTTRNCEDFARFCKIGNVGSKQVARVIFYTGVATGNIFASIVIYTMLRLHQNKRLEDRGHRG